MNEDSSNLIAQEKNSKVEGLAAVFYARKDQLLAEHLFNTANLTKKFATVFGCENMAYSAGLLHDLGKHTNQFQDYLTRCLAGEKVTRGEVIHALQGAKYSLEKIDDQVVADILANVIATHHGGLFDNITNGERTSILRTQKPEEEIHYEEAIKKFSPSLDQEAMEDEILKICLKCQEQALRHPSFSAFFMLHLLTKVLYSCLVDADRCDAAGIKPKDSLPDWVTLIKQLEKHLAGFENASSLDLIRKRISDQCQQGGRRKIGVYTLSVPTGGGKTLSSLRFALEHAREHRLKRIIYVIPYLSILDQTASKLREIFKDEELILEHHSNFELPRENDDDDEHYRLLTSRWDSPIILTTMVQFLETIFSNKAAKLRRFHNMSEAVLVFDEIQALPIKCVHLFNQAINFLHIFGKSTALLCTATQPHLHKTERPILLSENPDIVSITHEEMENFERVYIEDKTGFEMDHEEIVALAREQIDQGKSTLIILNTKGDARKVYEFARSLNCEKAFLTTDLCPAHRLTILERIKNNLALKTKRLTLCVSTQLIEAGVDISFDCVIRAKAGMDSLVQAAGRCNRNKESHELQFVIVVDVKGENLSRLPEINIGKEKTARVFRENQGKNLLEKEVMNAYYSYYFFEQRNKMDYIVHNNRTTIYSLLNDNPLDAVAYKNLNSRNYVGLPCAIQTAADSFSVIDGGQTGIVVPYGDALRLVADFRKCFDLKEKMRILKQLQKYSVSVYSHTLAKIEPAISAIENTFFLLSSEYYDAEQGLLLEAKFSLMYV